MSKIIIKNAVKKYGDLTIIPDLSVTIPEGSLFTLLGPSGCGKTTLLRMIAGFNTIEGGDFFFNETRINDLEPSKRDIGMVFQNYAIFPHLSVGQNVEFGLKQRKLPKDEITRRTTEYLKLINMEEYRDRKPDKLSGGQQQRVALARALVINPKVLLMDEPLSNLDAKLRLDMRQAIRDIQRKIGITTVYVTHDQEEAMAISDLIAVMNKGVILQIGQPKELYHRPATEFVAVFVGKTNVIEGKLVKKDGAVYLDLGFVSDIAVDGLEDVSEQDVRVSIRPEEFERSETGIKATIVDSLYLGLNTEYIMQIENGPKVQVIEESNFVETLQIGDVVSLEIKKHKINVFDKDGSVNLLGVK